MGLGPKRVLIDHLLHHFDERHDGRLKGVDPRTMLGMISMGNYYISMPPIVTPVHLVNASSVMDVRRIAR